MAKNIRHMFILLVSTFDLIADWLLYYEVSVSTFDLIADWLLYYEVSGIEQGLVFGPFSVVVLNFLTLFCCIGTVTYIAHLVLNLLEIFEPIDVFLPTGLLDNINLVSLWIEDVPLILMSVYIAGCRDTAVTVILLVKGLSTLLEVSVNVWIVITKCINNKIETEGIGRERKRKLTGFKVIFATIGLIFLLIGSLLMFGLSNYLTFSKTVIHLPGPIDINTRQYNTIKYLNRSGVYLNFDPGQTGVITMEKDEWIKLADLINIPSSQSRTLIVSITYDSNPNTRLWIQSTSSSDITSPGASTCYSTQTSPMSVLSTCSTDIPLTSNTTSIVFIFVYQSPSNPKPLGDIFFNYGRTTFTNTENCTFTMATPSFSLHYFKATTAGDYESPLVSPNGVDWEYFKSGSTLLSVSEAWTTGTFGCCHTGSSTSKQDTSISVPCLTWGPMATTMTTTTITTSTTTTTAGGVGGRGNDP